MGAIDVLAATVTKLVNAASEERSTSTIKWDRKRPVIKAEDAESLMNELVELENIYSDLNCKTWKKKWSVFRPALQGKAKDKVDLELEENRLTAKAIAIMDEESLERLYKYLIGCLEEEAHLTAEKRAQLATQAMAQVWMPPNSGPAGADQFVRSYEKAYLLELRAGLVITNEVVTAQRLFNYKEKLAPEVRQYLKGLPDAEQPISLQGMHRAVRKWAEIQREGQSSGKKSRWERIENFSGTKDKKQKEKEKKEKLKAEREKKEKEDEKKRRQQEQSGDGSKKPLWEHLAMIAQTAQTMQAFAKGKGKGGKTGQWSGWSGTGQWSGAGSSQQTKDWTKEKCHICGGKHLGQLRKDQCPNKIAEANGTAEANKKNNVKCTHWVDSKKTECGGSHSFEDHKAA